MTNKQLHVFEELKAILERDISKISFDDNSYFNEDFFKKSIENNFAGWYNKTAPQHQVDLILRTSKLSPPASILDIACGHGKHSELLASKGFKVIGIDISKTLIDFLAERNHANTNLNFYCCSFSNLEYENEFDLVIVLGNSLSLVPEPELKPTLENIHKSLKKGGKLFIELDNRLSFIRNEAGSRTWNIYNARWLVISEHYYDDDQKLEKTRDIGFDLDSCSVDEFVITKRLYDPDEFREILIESRYNISINYGDWDERALDNEAPYQIILASKI